MSVQDKLIDTIETVVKRTLDKYKFNQDVACVVTEINGNKYKVSIDGNDYWIKDGIGLGLTVGMGVWVHVPNGKLGNAYICAKR